MKIIQEYTIKIIIFCIILCVILEVIILIMLLIRSSEIFKSTYNQTIEKSENKSMEITEKIKDYTYNLVMRYNTDIKLICKHAFFLIGKNNNNSNVIHIESKLIKNNNEQKKIISSKLEDLLNQNYIKKIFNETTQIFDYIGKYNEEFMEISDRNEILNHLFSNETHYELNVISYYSSSNNEINQDSSLKFIISALKTIYIQRIISRRTFMDYFRFIILNKNEMYIYPAGAYNNTYLYYFNDTYPPPKSNCDYSSTNEESQFPLCVYDYIIEKIMSKTQNYLSIVYESAFYEKVYLAFCLKFPFLKEDINPPLICLEIDLFKNFELVNFDYLSKFEFGMFMIDSTKIHPLMYSRKSAYNDIKKIFNDTVNEKYLINDKNPPLFSLFHFLYYNLTKIAKEHPELNVNFTEIDEEYNIIRNQIIEEIDKFKRNLTYDRDSIKFSFSKSICKKGLLKNTYECLKDEFEMIIIPLILPMGVLNDDYIESVDTANLDLNIYIYSIISTNPYLNNRLITIILRLKIERTIILFFFLTFIIIIFFILLIYLLSDFSLNPINEILKKMQKMNFNNNSHNFHQLEEDKIIAPNKEMHELKNIYETMRKTLIIKQAFNKEFFLDKHNLEFYNLVQDIDKRNIKEICNSYLGFYHYKNDSYNLAENEISSTLGFIQENLNKVTGGKNSEFEDKIKDAIKRSSTVSYINEYTEFEKIEENLLAMINLNIFKQRFIYLYGMINFKLGIEVNNNNNININNISQTQAANKYKAKKNKDKRINYYKEAIKSFNECKNINNLLGINQIKIIYSLIMISKCYIQLNDYKHSIISINEALSLFFEFSKSFKDYHSKNYNPKIMLFVENNIFHYILFIIERIYYSFNKPMACNWIILKIFETSPFLISNVHLQSAIFLQTYLEKNTLKKFKVESKFVTNTALNKEYEKQKKYFSKIVSRSNVKNINNKYLIIKTDKSIGDNSNYSYKTKIESKTEKSIFTSTLKRETMGGKSSSFHYKNRNLNKIITLCLSEKILEKVNGLELKDVIIKYFEKYFIMNENDKFSFIQFANNGKKTVYFKMEKLDYFLLKIQKAKNTFELTDSFVINSNMPFSELYNLLSSIIKNYNSSEDFNITDNIIIMFINSEDIRFTSVSECLNIVEDLNKKNTSIFLLSYDEEIKNEKINNIQSFLDGLFEGYFFQIKNYQQLKQIFINISTIKYESNFFGYDYDCLDNEL